MVGSIGQEEELAGGASGAGSEYELPDWLTKTYSAFEKSAQRFAFVAVTAVLIMAFANVFDIVLRNFFATSLYGLNEINVLLVAIAVSSCLPFGMARGSALRIDIVRGRVPTYVADWLNAYAAVFVLVFFTLLAWRVGHTAADIQRTGQTTVLTDIPKAPFFWGVTLALCFTALVQATVTLKAFFVAARATPNMAWLMVLGGVVALGYPALTLASLAPADMFYVLNPGNALVLSGLIFAIMWLLILGSVPIGVSMGILGIIGTATILDSSLAMEVLGSETTSFITREGLSVLPLFLLMGAFASVAGIGTDLYRLANALVGHVRGGLAHASIMACAGFGMLTGSSIATQMSIGKIALKEMQEHEYSQELSAGSIAAGGTLGQLIPPSSALILFAVMTEQSVGQLFIGAVVPGLLAAVLYMSTVTVWLWIYPSAAAKGPKSSFREIYEASKGSWSVLALLGLVLGGIYFGFFTELEAGSVGAAGGFLIAVARGRINLKTFWSTMGNTTGTLAMMYSLIFGVAMLSFFFGIAGLPQAFVAWVDGFGFSNLGIILCLVLAYLILGTAMDAFAMMVITIPIFVPLVASMGYDPIWWGLMTLVCMEAGQISPPFGINIFVINALDPKMPIGKVYKGCWPFFASTVVKIALLIAFPALVTWLPSTM